MGLDVNSLENADEQTLVQAMQQIIKRYSQLHPNWEVCFLSLPKNDPQQRKATLDWIIQHGL